MLEPKLSHTDIGIIYLDVAELEEIFIPIIEDVIGEKWRFSRVWGHFMKKGGSRPWHTHSTPSFLYYLSIPEGKCGYLSYNGLELKPKEGTLVLFPRRLNHKITENETDEVRWAIAAELIKGLEDESAV